MQTTARRAEARATLSLIVSLAWPTVIEQAMSTAVQYVDTAMVGVLGTQATAAVGATGTVGWLLFCTISAVSVGFLAFIAKACGANDRQSAQRASAQSVLMTLLLGSVLTLVVAVCSWHIPVWMQVDESIRQLSALYFFIIWIPVLPRAASAIFGTVLRAAGDTKTPMKVGVLVNLINVILNFFLIYQTRPVSLGPLTVTIWGAGWGVVGAAIASAISVIAGGVLITMALWRHPMVSPRGASFRPDGAILRPCLRIALPNALQQFSTCMGFVAFAAMINSLGEVSTAAHTIANTVESAFYIPGHGMSTAASTLAGNAYGAGDARQMKSLARMFIPLELVLMLLSGGALFAFAPALVSLFTKSVEVVALGSVVLRMVAVSEPFYGFSIIMEGLMMGVGKTRAPFLYNLAGMWLLRVAGTTLCIRVLRLGLVSAWACMIAHNMLVFVLYLIDYFRGTWNPLHRHG